MIAIRSQQIVPLDLLLLSNATTAQGEVFLAEVRQKYRRRERQEKEKKLKVKEAKKKKASSVPSFPQAIKLKAHSLKWSSISSIPVSLFCRLPSACYTNKSVSQCSVCVCD